MVLNIAQRKAIKNAIPTSYTISGVLFSHTTNIPLTIFEIDEIYPDNKQICRYLYITQHKTDINGNNKYYMFNNNTQWELHQRDNWEEYIPEFPI